MEEPDLLGVGELNNTREASEKNGFSENEQLHNEVMLWSLRVWAIVENKARLKH